MKFFFILLINGDTMNPQTNFSGDSFLSDFDRENVKNFCSWLLNFNEYELPLISYGIAVLLAETFTIQERTVIGSLFSTIATNTFLIAAQKGFLLQFKYNTSNNDISKRVKNIEEVLKRNNLI